MKFLFIIKINRHLNRNKCSYVSDLRIYGSSVMLQCGFSFVYNKKLNPFFLNNIHVVQHAVCTYSVYSKCVFSWGQVY